MIKSMLHNPHIKKGISLIEILILLLIISIFATFVIPAFITKQKDAIKKQFISEFIALMNDSLYQAITTQKICQIYFDLDKNMIIPKVQDLSIETENKHKKFKPLYTNNTSGNVQIPQHFSIKNFFIQNEDEFRHNKTMHDAWFYIMPDGTSQRVIINYEYNDPDSQDTEQFSLSINPFYSQVHQHETFQKP